MESMIAWCAVYIVDKYTQFGINVIPKEFHICS